MLTDSPLKFQHPFDGALCSPANRFLALKTAAEISFHQNAFKYRLKSDCCCESLHLFLGAEYRESAHRRPPTLRIGGNRYPRGEAAVQHSTGIDYSFQAGFSPHFASDLQIESVE